MKKPLGRASRGSGGMRKKAVAEIVTEWQGLSAAGISPRAIANQTICRKLPRPMRLRACRATQRRDGLNSSGHGEDRASDLVVRAPISCVPEPCILAELERLDRQET